MPVSRASTEATSVLVSVKSRMSTFSAMRSCCGGRCSWAAPPDLRVVLRAGSPDDQRLVDAIAARGLSADVVELDEHDAEHLSHSLGDHRAVPPKVVLNNGEVLHAPSNAELDAALLRADPRR
ncbi:hypothetical protein AB6N24_01760 [Cellulomonas sp. 179-A 4D5 NHS]|uniref:hypothetical protein n=1 Tax=Cellulomonas sp. 179-A 4D5 NHS TaxID=3142378 RepID=UPI0039A277C0